MRVAVEDLTLAARDHDVRIDDCLSRVGVVRFDAYHDLGGRQSTAVAFLNSLGNGVVITTVVSRDFARMYVKLLQGRRGRHPAGPRGSRGGGPSGPRHRAVHHPAAGGGKESGACLADRRSDGRPRCSRGGRYPGPAAALTTGCWPARTAGASAGVCRRDRRAARTVAPLGWTEPADADGSARQACAARPPEASDDVPETETSMSCDPPGQELLRWAVSSYSEPLPVARDTIGFLGPAARSPKNACGDPRREARRGRAASPFASMQDTIEAVSHR